MGRFARLLQPMGVLVSIVLAVALAPQWELPAAAADPAPPGSSRFHPIQSVGSAAGRPHEVAATRTAAANSVPPSGPVLPPGTTGVVGPEKRFPDPVPVDGPQCRGCPTATTVPMPQPANGKSPATDQRVNVTQAEVTGFVPGVSVELLGARTETSTTFANPDGTKALRTYSGPRFVRNAAGVMVPIDTRLQQGSDGRYRPVSAQPVSFAARSSDESIGLFDVDTDVSVGFGPADAAAVAGTVKGSDIVFTGVRRDSDLVVGAIGTGIKETIVLRSVSAPTRWRFPLRLHGLTPEVVPSDGRIDLRDAAGTVRLTVPAGFMFDSASGPGARDGAYSHGVRYSVSREGDGWMLDVLLDEQWLSEPARRFPVMVDPTLTRFRADHDTFASSNDFAHSDNQFASFMKVGTYNGGGEVSAGYVNFNQAWFNLYRKRVLAASLSLHTKYSGPPGQCTAAPLSVYRTTWEWAGANVNPWPGPPWDAARPVAVKTFARGQWCPNGQSWEKIDLDPARFTEWTHLTEGWTGFTLRTSSGDNKAEKYFSTFEAANGTTAPFLDVLYADEGASFALPTARISPPVTPSTQGRLDVLARNLGQTDWTPTNGFKLVCIVRNASGAEVQRTTYPVTTTVHSVGAETTSFNVAIGPLAAGNYTLRLTMQDGSGRLFDDFYGSSAATAPFQVLPEAVPEIVSIHPPNNAQVDTVRPTLWAQYYDADNAPGGPWYWFRICNGTPEPPVGCQDTNWITSATWNVPAGVLAWSTHSFWYVAVQDGANMTYLEGPYYLTPVVAQPEVTHHLAGAPENADVPGLNPQVGNYSTTAVDAAVPVAGPPLEIRRTYNSQDPRTTGVFGAGWSTPLDQRVGYDPDGSGNVVVTLASGRQVRFARNADGSYAPPPGHNMTLVNLGDSWKLRDASGEMRQFDGAGRLTLVFDAYGRAQQFLYSGGLVYEIKDLTSARTLYLTWSGGRVTTVKTDVPTAGGPQPTWSYTYTGNQLTRVCTPLSPQSCVDYQYTPASHYRSVVVDDNPTAYWPLSETSGATATNVVARSPGEHSALYAGVTLNQPGALAGSPDRAVQIAGSATSGLILPVNFTNLSLNLTVELWFKAASGQRGVLYAYQDTDLSRPAGNRVPALYVDTEGKLRGKHHSPGATQIVSPARVDNGQWHHAVLVGTVDRWELYLDGVRIGQQGTGPIAFLNMGHAFVGNGFATGWPLAVTGNFPFNGQIDEVAIYRHPLGAVQVGAHYAARTATSRLTKLIEPGAFTALDVTYDGWSGRVAAMRDRHGAQWTVAQPALGQGARAVTISAAGRDAVTYTYDANRGGRLTTRQTGAGVETWEYDENSFLTKYIDANDRERYFVRDSRGNVTWEVVFRSGAWVHKNFGYFYNAADKLDPRNDRVIWQSGTRSAWDTDPLNRIWYDMDSVGRVIKITSPSPAGTSAQPTEIYVYTNGTEAAAGGGTVPAGLLKGAQNRAGGVTTLEYNSRGDLVRSVDPIGLTTAYTYDPMGRNLSRTTSALWLGQTVTYGTWSAAYNAASLVTSETAPAVTNPITGTTHTAVTTYGYDTRGSMMQRSVADSTGGDATRVWRYAYDAAGRPTTTTAPDSGLTTREWNTAGDVAKLTRANGLVIEYRYNDRRQVVEAAAVGAGVDPMDPAATRLVLEARAYDPAGQLASVVDAMGRETAITYHNDGLKESEKRVRRNADGEITSEVLLGQYEYDHGGKLIRTTEAGGVVRDFDFDDAGLRTRETLDAAGLARTTAYTFTPDGLIASKKQTNGWTFVTGRSAEAPYLFANSGSQVDGAGSRYADGSATFTYRFALPADAATATVDLEIDNQYVVHVSTDNQNWTESVRETRDIRNGANRRRWLMNMTAFLPFSKTLYVRIGDSQPGNGWGGAVSRVSVEFTRTGQQPATASHQYDSNGNLTRTTVDNPGGSPATLVTSIDRDPRGLASANVDPASLVTDFVYDGAGNLLYVDEPPRTVWRDGVRTDNLRPRTRFGYNTFGDATHKRDEYNATTVTGYDPMGRPVSVTLPPYTPPGGSPLTPTTTTSYNVDGQPVEATDPLGRRTSRGYDRYGHETSTTLPDPDGSGPAGRPVWAYAYDRVGELLQTTDPVGARTLATYNDLGHQITDTAVERVGPDTLFYTTHINRNEAGLPISVASPLSHFTAFEHNKAGEETKATDAVGLVTESRYDAVGRPTARIHAGARATTFGYDGAGRLVAESDHTVAGGVLSAPIRTSATSYDVRGRPVQRTSGAGRLTLYGYNGGGNLTSITQRANPADPATAITVDIGYDALGRHTRTVDGNGNATDFQYNDWGLVTSVQEPGASFTTVYDAAGQPVREDLPGGVSRVPVFDGLGRLTAETGGGAVDPTAARGLTYDAVGRVTKATSPAGDITYTYNDRGLLTRSVGPAGTATFEYDGDGHLVSRTDPSGTGTFTYDAAGRLATSVDALTSRVATYGYAPTGELTSVSHGSGLPSRTYGYENLGRLTTDVVKSSSGTPVLSTSYGYDLDDLVTSRNTTGFAGGGTNTYGYDGLARLTSWTRPGGQLVSYGYDRASNRTSETGSNGIRTFTYDARNRLLTGTGAGPTLTNTWSARGTLDSTTLDGAATTYRSDAFDRTVAAQSSSVAVTYAYDALDRLAQRNGAAFAYPDLTNNPVRVPTTVGDALVFRGPDGVALSDKHGTDSGQLVVVDRLHGDHVGAVDPSTGTVTASRSYAPYGETTVTTGRFSAGFQGGLTDIDTGQVNAHARWYNPSQASFTSRDSWSLHPDPVPAANRYAYANANPTTYADPTGHAVPVALAGAAMFGGPVGWLVLGAVAIGAVGFFAYQGHSQGWHNPLAGLFGKPTAVVDTSAQSRAASSERVRIQLEQASRDRAAAAAQAAVAAAAAQQAWQVTLAAAAATGTALANQFIAQVEAAAAAIVAARMPVSQAVSNYRAPEASLVPAGQQLQNTVTAAAAAAIPNITIVNADGSDAANAAVAGAVAIAGAPGGDDDDGCRPRDSYRPGTTVEPVGRIWENYDTYLTDVAKHYGINLRGVRPIWDDNMSSAAKGVTREAEGGWIIRIHPGFHDEADLANTIAHELHHARKYQKGLPTPEELAQAAGDALEEWICGRR